MFHQETKRVECVSVLKRYRVLKRYHVLKKYPVAAWDNSSCGAKKESSMAPHFFQFDAPFIPQTRNGLGTIGPGKIIDNN